ncbi:MlaE family ABC transporter permease [Frateuria aurantia]
MNAPHPAGQAHVDTSTSPPRLRFSGSWTLASYQQLLQVCLPLQDRVPAQALTDVSEVTALDTAGADLINRLCAPIPVAHRWPDSDALPSGRLAMLRLVAEARTAYGDPVPLQTRRTLLDWLAQIGQVMAGVGQTLVELLGFGGLVLATLARGLAHPSRWRMTSLSAQIEQTGWNAIPIVTLLTFLVGAVVAFLGATVLRDFGATIYTVDLVAFSFLREFGVLLTAILLAGRTASAFTAQIGSMRSNQEVDALRTLGLDPIELLVIPRVMALLISLPALTFIAMLAGLCGGALVCSLTLEISPTMFMGLLRTDIPVRHFLVGLAKAPVFAFVIALIGCREGFRVSGSAASVGSHTTSSVVQSIFVVIVLDALAALFFMEMNW